MRRFGFWMFGAAFVLTAAALYGLSVSANNRPVEIATTPPIIPVTRGIVDRTVSAPGRLIGTREIMLGTNASARVRALRVRPGDVVEAGDLLAELDCLADCPESDARIIAPFDGVVSDVLALPGALVQGNLIHLTDVTALEVLARVVEEDLPLIVPGQPVELMFDALPGEVISGRVARIVPQQIPGENTVYPVVITLDDVPAALLPGMTTDATIAVETREGVLRLPRALVRAGGNGEGRVNVWNGERIEERTVNVGLRGNVYVEILDGLQESEQVVSR